MTKREPYAEVWGKLCFERAQKAALAKSLRRLVVAARTSGGTAGRDEGLVGACEKAEAALNLFAPPQ
jgi:hypothetical protein